MKPREILTWKFLVYQVALPLLRSLGPRRADALLNIFARSCVHISPFHRRKLSTSLARVGMRPDLAQDLGAGALRFLARDYLLEGRSSNEVGAFFDVEGGEALADALQNGRGAVLVGSHLGAHISGLHWFYQRGISLRVMVQRPKHITKTLRNFFDRNEEDPQSEFFLRRGLTGSDCVKRLLRARNALKSGKALYLAGDIPWQGGNTRTGMLLGRPFRFLSIWADLAAAAHSPVFFVFCSHEADGRFSLRIEPYGEVRSGSESIACSRYLERLESEILKNPADAPAHLLWPCFGVSKAPDSAKTTVFRPSRRAAPLSLP